MRTKHAIGYVVILVSIITEAATMAQMPATVDIPKGPADVQAPGGRELPAMAGKPVSGAPAISAVSDVSFPDETLVIAGDKLDGAQLRLWAEGEVRDVAPLRTAHDRMQAVVPKDMPVSAMLIWPVRRSPNGHESIGAPIRINAATAWWAWPARARARCENQTVRVFGKNITLPGVTPKAYLQGPTVSQWITVKRSNPYHLEAALPGDLKEGTYRVWVHNGTGGPCGWSEPVTFEVVSALTRENLKTFRVDDFGARPGDSADDAAAISAAVTAAAKDGGGIVAFSAGTYHVSRAIETPADAAGGIHFVGAGMGKHDVKTDALSGTYTAIRFAEGGRLPSAIIRLGRRFSSIRDMALINGSSGHEGGLHDVDDGTRQVVVRAYAHDLAVERTRLILLDRRPDVPQEERKDLNIFEAALHINAPGIANIEVRECEIHSVGGGVEIATVSRSHMDAGFPEPSTDYVRIHDCVLRGYSIGWYKHPKNNRRYAHMGLRNSGVQNGNGKNIIVENCDFAGADRRGGKMINRSVCNYNTSIRHMYLANNTSHDVGMVCPRDDCKVNQGEQILFHFRYPYGGYFDVIDASPRSVSVNPDDPRNADTPKRPHTVCDRTGSRVLEEVGTNDHWIVFIAAGKGVGQYRVVVGSRRSPGRAELQVDRPWRVVPDTTSRVVLTASMRQNIIYGNTIDAGFIDPNSKVGGTQFWFNSFENIVANNTYRNLSYGVVFNCGFRNPNCWNLARENVMENMHGFSAGGSQTPSCYTNCYYLYHFDRNPAVVAASDEQGWYSVGNIARANRGTNAEAAAYLHGFGGKPQYENIVPQPDAGMMMEVIENNHFTHVDNGIVISPPATWIVIRNNVVVPNDAATPEVLEQSGGKIEEALIVEKQE